MSARLNPYLSFDGNAREAMEAYRGIFGGTLTVNTYGEAGTPDQAYADKVMHAMLETDLGFALMASDNPPGARHEPGTSVAVSLSGDDDALRGYWEQLSAGGSVSVPFEKQMWGDEFGMCVDRFGVPWMVNLAAPQG